MSRSKNKIALLLPVKADDSLGWAGLLTEEGFKLGVGGQVQSDLERVVENIGNGALGLHIETSCLNGIVPVFKKVTCYFNGRIDLLLLNTANPSDKGHLDLTEAFFMIQYALPFLTPKATVLFNGPELTREQLAFMLSQPANQVTGVKIFWNGNLFFNRKKITKN
jgi:hypothetical protein